MTDLSKLSVSLTKHGAHKLSTILRQFDSDELLENLDGSIPGVNIERAQAKKNLSVYQGNNVPNVWQEAKIKGNDYIGSLVFIGIVFSHHKLIKAMQESFSRSTYCGTIQRGHQLDGKPFTNFAHIIDELGFATKHTKNEVSYNLKSIFELSGINKLTKDLLRLKLEKANWDEKNDIVDEMLKLRFHDVFSIEPTQFRYWLTSISTTATAAAAGKFQFKKGHNKRKTGASDRQARATDGQVQLRHNEIQNMLFDSLSKEYGDEYVGTEIATGQGTFIDIVVKTEEFCWFYEIKTASTVKASIREAIPQLLEYAYWTDLGFEVDKLIIVSEEETEPESEKYLEYLRNNFGLNLYYQSFTIPES